MERGSWEDGFEPEAVLPAQFFAGPELAALEPERRLMLAVLEDGLAVVLRGSHNPRAPRGPVTEARAWLESDAEDWLFGFVPLCDALGISADTIRRAVLARVANGAQPPVRRHRVVGTRHKVSGRMVA